MRHPIRDRSARITRRRTIRHAFQSLEHLEARRLMAVGINEIALDSLSHSPISDILPMADGSVWFTGYNSNFGNQNGVWKRSSDGSLSTVPELAGLSNPRELIKGPDGSVWVLSGSFTEGGRVSRLNERGVDHYGLSGIPTALAFGPDGNLAIAVNRSALTSESMIVRMTPEGVSSVVAGTGQRILDSLIVGASGEIWFTDGTTRIMERLSTDGVLTSFSLDATARQLTPGANGTMWFAATTDDGQGAIGQLLNNGTTLLSPLGTRSYVTGLAPAADGSVWYTDTGMDAVAKLAPSGQITLIPTPTDRSAPENLVSDGAGGFWFINDRYKLSHVLTDLPEPSIQLAAMAFVAPEGPLMQDVVVASFTTNDLSAKPADFVARVDLGTAASQSLNGEIRTDGPGRFLVMAPWFRQNDFGTALMTVTILDARNSYAVGKSSTLLGVATFDVVAPVVLTSHASTVTVGRTQEIVLADLKDDYLSGTLTGSIDWGDGSVSTAEFVIIGWTGAGFSVKGSHAYATPGNYTVTTTVYDNGRPVVVTSPVAVVPSRLVTWSAELGASSVAMDALPSPLENLMFTTGVANASAASFVATVDWGDGTTSDAQVIQNGVDPQYFYVMGDHAYDAPGTYTITVRLQDVLGFSEAFVSSRTVNVLPAPAPPLPLPDFVPEGRTLKGVQDAPIYGIVATFFDYYAANMADYSAEVSWGDGTRSEGLVSTYQGQMIVYASHIYASAGSFKANVSVQKAGYASVAVDSTITVAARQVVVVVPPTPVPPTPLPSKPRVVSARAFSAVRGGASIVLGFSGTVDPATVADVSRYRVTDAGVDGKLGTKDDRVVKIKTAKYDEAKRQLTLTPRGLFSRKTPFRVGIRGEAVMTAAWDRTRSLATRR